MKRVTLYIYKGAVGPKNVDGSEEWGYRLIADSGKQLSNGEVECDCIDIKNGDPDNWEEIETEPAEIEDYTQALAQLGVSDNDD